MVHPLVGKPAPEISAPGADGETYTVTPGQKGVPVALFFYPKSGAPLACPLVADASSCSPCAPAGSFGCTKEACQFRDALAGESRMPCGPARDPSRSHCASRYADNELFKRTKVEIVGISSDPVDKQKAFVEKQKLTVSAAPACFHRLSFV